MNNTLLALSIILQHKDNNDFGLDKLFDTCKYLWKFKYKYWKIS
jgi:hypothetical protein